MENRTINIGVVAEIAAALKHLKDKVVFVGGAVVSLYTDDPAADEIRPTQDIDMTLQVINLTQWLDVQEQLSQLGFRPDASSSSICRYRYKDIPVDFMGTEDSPFGATNSWFKQGFEDLWTITVKNHEIKILSAPYYLATKFEAFKDRGMDYRTSHDIEDIIYVIDNRTTIVEEVKGSNQVVQRFIKQELEKLKKTGLLRDVLIAHIHPLIISDRLPLVEGKIDEMIAD